MKKIFIFMLLFFPCLSYAWDYNLPSTTLVDNTNTISETSSDLNKDKLKVIISDKLSVETWFWNYSSKWDWYVDNIMKLLKFLSIIIFTVGLISILIVVLLIIFNSDDLNKIKDYKKIISIILIWFFFYWFAAGLVYVYIIDKWKKLSENYYNEIINEKSWNTNYQPVPSLFRND